MKALILALAAFSILTGPVETSAHTQETVRVALGKSKDVDQGRIKIKFLSVVEDSRCPVNATCVWAGNAKIRISITKGKSGPEILELNTLTEPTVQAVYGYHFKIKDLHPQKGDGPPIVRPMAVLTVERK